MIRGPSCFPLTAAGGKQSPHRSVRFLPLWCLGHSRLGFSLSLLCMRCLSLLLADQPCWGAGRAAGSVLRVVSDLQDMFVKGRICWWMAAVTSTPRAPSSTAVTAACPTAAVALTSAASPAACSPTRYGELLLVLHLLLSFCLYCMMSIGLFPGDSWEDRTLKGTL